MSCIMTFGLLIEFILVMFSLQLKYFALLYFINPWKWNDMLI